MSVRQGTQAMENSDGLAILERIHFRMMKDKRMWHSKDWMEADSIVCILASNMRKEFTVPSA